MGTGILIKTPSLDDCQPRLKSTSSARERKRLYPTSSPSGISCKVVDEKLPSGQHTYSFSSFGNFFFQRSLCRNFFPNCMLHEFFSFSEVLFSKSSNYLFSVLPSILLRPRGGCNLSNLCGGGFVDLVL